MANLYEFVNQFRLVDINGSILSNPGDEIIITEPDQFRGVSFELMRSPQYHGFNYEFSDLSLGFSRILISGEDNNAYDLIKSIYDADGVDSQLAFQFYTAPLSDPTNFTIQLDARLIFGDIDIQEAFIKLPTIRIALDDLFQTRVGTDVNFGSSTTIEGTSITPPTAVSTFIHGKNNTINQNAGSFPASGGFFANDDNWFLQLDYLTNRDPLTFSNAVSAKFGGGASTTLVSTDFIRPHYLFMDTAGVLSGTLIVNYELTINNIIAAAPDPTYLGVYARIGSREVALFSTSTTYPIDFPNQEVVCAVNQTVNFNLFVGLGESVYFYDKWTIPFINFTLHTWQIIPNSGGGDGNGNLEMDFTTNNESSTVETYSPFDSIEHVLKVITNETSPLISDFFTNVANEIRLTNGYRIRNLPQRNVITNFEELFDNWSQPSFGLGYAIVEDSGIFKILMERYDHFYNNAEIVAFTTIDNDSWSETADEDIIFNEIDIGYSEFAKSTDDNKSNNIDDFLTRQSLLTPIQTVKNEATYISDVIASSFKWENQRLEQFQENPNDTVADDDKIFCVNTLTSNNYTGVRCSFFNIGISVTDGVIELDGSFFDVSEGDTITFSNTSSNNGSYTINSIEREISSNSNFEIGLRLRVTANLTTELNATGVTLTLAAPINRALRDEEFSILDGIQSPETIINAGLNPKNMLANQSLIINSGLNKKPGTAEILTREVKLNGGMRSRFAVGQGSYVLDPGRETVTQEDNVVLNDLNNFNKLFTGNLLKFTTTTGYGVLQTIRDACLRQGPSGVWFGYISVTDPFGVVRTGWILSMNYNPLNEQVSFTLRERFV